MYHQAYHSSSWLKSKAFSTRVLHTFNCDLKEIYFHMVLEIWLPYLFHSVWYASDSGSIQIFMFFLLDWIQAPKYSKFSTCFSLHTEYILIEYSSNNLNCFSSNLKYIIKILRRFHLCSLQETSKFKNSIRIISILLMQFVELLIPLHAIPETKNSAWRFSNLSSSKLILFPFKQYLNCIILANKEKVY